MPVDVPEARVTRPPITVLSSPRAFGQGFYAATERFSTEPTRACVQPDAPQAPVPASVVRRSRIVTTWPSPSDRDNGLPAPFALCCQGIRAARS